MHSKHRAPIAFIQQSADLTGAYILVARNIASWKITAVRSTAPPPLCEFARQP